MKIGVIGAGYVGLVTGACLAKLGNELIMVDIDAHKVESLNNKCSTIHEKHLDELIQRFDIEVSCNPRRMEESEVIFICVGTPLGRDGSISLEQVIEAAKQASEVLKRKEEYCLIIVRSTVPPGTTEDIVIPLLQKSGKKIGEDFGICMSPEFLSAGNAVHDFMNPSRVVIGEYDRKSGDVLSNLFRSLDAPILRTNLKTAEMIKLASNAFLATKISFANEIGNICKQLGIDSYEVSAGMGSDDRIGSKFLSAGIGFGGSCLPKDLNMLLSVAKEIGYTPRILGEVLSLNDRQALRLIDLLKKHIPLNGATVGLLGLAFKPDTDDVRNSRAIKIAEVLLKERAVVKAYDPIAVSNFRKHFPQIEYVSREEILNCDAILILTEWEEFEKLDYRGRIVIDGRRISKAREAKVYEGVCW